MFVQKCNQLVANTNSHKEKHDYIQKHSSGYFFFSGIKQKCLLHIYLDYLVITFIQSYRPEYGDARSWIVNF